MANEMGFEFAFATEVSFAFAIAIAFECKTKPGRESLCPTQFGSLFCAFVVVIVVVMVVVVVDVVIVVIVARGHRCGRRSARCGCAQLRITMRLFSAHR